MLHWLHFPVMYGSFPILKSVILYEKGKKKKSEEVYIYLGFLVLINYFCVI